MIEKAAALLTARLQRSNVIEDDAREIYIYGFELAISSVVNFALILTLACLYRRPLDAVIYTICTRPLRTNGGGWHADTHWLCITLHATAFSVVSWLCFWVWAFVPWHGLLIIHAVSFAIVWFKAPVEHPNNPLNEEAKQNIRRKCMLYMVLFIAVSMAFAAVGQHYIAVLMTLSSASAIGTFLVKNKGNCD